MSARDEFSFVVPVFNTDPAYLHACVMSTAQAAARYGSDRTELIVVDDGSSAALAAEYRRIVGSIPTSSMRVTLRRLTENHGIASARNRGIEQAHGTWVLLVDSDDIVEPSALNRISAHLGEDTVLAFTAHEKRGSDLSAVIETRRKSRYAEMLRAHAGGVGDPFLHYTFLIHMHVIRRAAYFAVGGFNTSIAYGDEIDFHLRLTSAYREASNYVYVDDVLYIYRDNPGGVCRDPVKYSELIRTIEKLLLRHARSRGLDVSACQRSGKEPDGAVAYHYH